MQLIIYCNISCQNLSLVMVTQDREKIERENTPLSSQLWEDYKSDQIYRPLPQCTRAVFLSNRSVYKLVSHHFDKMGWIGEVFIPIIVKLMGLRLYKLFWL